MNPGLWSVHMVTQDGAAPTTIHGFRSDPAELNFLFNSSTSAVWELRGAAFGPPEAHPSPGPKVLVIGVGGGVDIMNALAHGAGHVTGAEINPEILKLLKTRYRDFAGGLAARDDVRLVNADGRAFVRGTDQRYDVIQLAGVDTFTALASGAYSLAEAYVYTLEAFDDFFEHLTDTGCLSVSRLILDPPRETLRLAVTADFALRRAGARRAYRHIAVIRANLWSTLVACRQPIAPAAMQRVRDFAARGQFQVVFDPERPGKDEFTRALVGSKTARFAFFDAYRYRVLPARDEAPFFFNYFRLRDLGRVRSMHSESMYGTAVPIGHGVLLLTLFVTVLLGAIGILRPLRRFDGVKGSGAFGTYFACLGFGFLLVEIALIQRLTFFLGHPTYALTVVLSGLLVASGVGAAMSKWGAAIGPRLFALIAVVLFAAAAFSYWGLPRQVGLDFSSRLGVSLLLIAPARRGAGDAAAGRHRLSQTAWVGGPDPLGLWRERVRHGRRIRSDAADRAVRGLLRTIFNRGRRVRPRRGRALLSESNASGGRWLSVRFGNRVCV